MFFWLDHILSQSETKVCAGVWEFIGALRRSLRPPVIGLLTGNIRLGAEIKLRHAELWGEFETGAFADDHEERAGIAAIAVKRGASLLKEELHGEEVLIIGDTPLDIACARALGAKVLAVATGGYSLAELQAHKPDFAFESLESVTEDNLAGSAIVG